MIARGRGGSVRGIGSVRIDSSVSVNILMT